MSSQESDAPNKTLDRPKRTATVNLDPLSAAHIYYGDSHTKKDRVRTYSSILTSAAKSTQWMGSDFKAPARRTSHDERPSHKRKFVIPVEDTLDKLYKLEDTDGNQQITIDDMGPKVLSIGTASSNGYKRFDLRGNYNISNLLQELTLAKEHGRKTVTLDEDRLMENPVNRLCRLIQYEFWPNLTRKIDGGNIAQVARDPKDWTADPRPRIYIPVGAPEQYEYYTKIAKEQPEIRLDVQWLGEIPDDENYVRDLNAAPGLLAVALDKKIDENGNEKIEGKPFVVPGGRFNELYGWDSYMETLGLLIHDRIDLVKPMIEHFCFCIRHYGKILNANRSYYLCRSQPPFLTDMALRLYERIKHEPGSLEFFREAIFAAIKEYYSVWMSEPRYDSGSGLSRYRAGGFGVPPETEATHFVHVLTPYAEKHNMTFEEFVDAYNHRRVLEPELDEYFIHDRAVRESGHDTSYRLEGVAGNLATVDLNSLLFKYECDIARAIRVLFGDNLQIPDHWLAKGQKPGHTEHSSDWDRRARKRRLLMDKYLWNEEKGMYFDYDTVKKEATDYECATTFWPMWAGVATPRQAAVLVKEALPKLEALGGLLSGTKESRGKVGLDKPNRQWDYPYGWAPQQMLAWVGLLRYGFEEEAMRLCYRWLFMVTKAFVDFNGVVVEKYNITQPTAPHKVDAEYGNQGADFKGAPKEGFGWVNASYVLGMTIINAHMRRALGALTDWDTYLRATKDLGLEDL